MRSLPADVRLLAARQDGVVTAAQLIRLGMDPSRPPRLVAAGYWQRCHRGVYVTHNGPVAWRTAARAALAYCGSGAALSRRSAGYVRGLVPKPPVIEVDIPATRCVMPSAGISIRRRRVMPDVSAGLAVVNTADTVLDLVAAAPDEDAAVAVLCAAARSGVPAWRVTDALAERERCAWRPLVVEVLGDVAEGVESPLERRYRRRVERGHGLPRARLQLRDRVGGLWIRSDAEYQGFGVRIELDGRLAHQDRDAADVWRDNAVLVERGQITLRYRWSHVAGTPCETSRQVAAALRAGGWRGSVRPCGPGCTAA